jgi:hypothetical protein
VNVDAIRALCAEAVRVSDEWIAEQQGTGEDGPDFGGNVDDAESYGHKRACAFSTGDLARAILKHLT